MLVDKARLLLVIVKLRQERVGLGLAHAVDVVGHEAIDVERLLAGLGVDAHHRMRPGRRVGRRAAAADGDVIADLVAVGGAQAVDPRFHRRGQRVVSRVLIGKERVAAGLRHFDAVEHGAGDRVLGVAKVGMEEHLAVGQRADRLAVLADVRDQHDRGMSLRRAARRMRQGQRPEYLGITRLVVLAQLLPAHQQHRMVVPRLAQGRRCCGGDRPA